MNTLPVNGVLTAYARRCLTKRAPRPTLPRPTGQVPAVARPQMPSRQQVGILRMIGDLENLRGFPPSVRKLTRRFDAPPVTVRGIIDRLTAGGFIRTDPQRATRSVLLTVAGQMYAFGWRPGRAPCMNKESTDIDIRVTQRRRCAECHASGLKFVAMHKPLRDGQVLCGQYIVCPRCGFSRNM